MNKQTFISAIAEKSALSKIDSKKALEAFMEVITEQLSIGEKVALTGFGAFSVSDRPERAGRNPQTQEAITIKASKAPKFKAGKELKESINL